MWQGVVRPHQRGSPGGAQTRSGLEGLVAPRMGMRHLRDPVNTTHSSASTAWRSREGDGSGVDDVDCAGGTVGLSFLGWTVTIDETKEGLV